jgi:hypothetical protein
VGHPYPRMGWRMTVKELFTYRILTISNVLSLIAHSRVFPPCGTFLHTRTISTRIRLYTALTLAFMTADRLPRRLSRAQTRPGNPARAISRSDCRQDCDCRGLFLLVYYRDYPLWVTLIVAVREIIGTVGGGFLLIKRNVLGKPNYWGKFGVGLISLSGLFYLFNWPYREYTIPSAALCIRRRDFRLYEDLRTHDTKG